MKILDMFFIWLVIAVILFFITLFITSYNYTNYSGFGFSFTLQNMLISAVIFFISAIGGPILTIIFAYSNELNWGSYE